MPLFSKYRHRITIQEESRVADGQGGYTTGWTDILTTWGKVEPIKGQQTLEAGQIVGGKPYKVRMRYRNDLVSQGGSHAEIVNTNRLKYDNRILDIHWVGITDERDREYQITAVQKVQ